MALAVGVDVRVGVAVRVGVEVGVALGVAVGSEVRVALDCGMGVDVLSEARTRIRVDVALAVGVGVRLPVALNCGLGVELGVTLPASSDSPGSRGVGVVIITAAARAFDVLPDTGVGVALASDRAEGDTVLDGGTGMAVGVALAAITKVVAGAASEVGLGLGVAVATVEWVGLGITVTAAGSTSIEVDRARRVGVGVGLRELTTRTCSVPPHPASSEPTNNIKKIRRILASMLSSPGDLRPSSYEILTPNVSRPYFHRITLRSRSGDRV